ncbi:FecR domain-containing protein [Flavitalea sp. BT771]|uniref:FecR family protein n=1 Tax=Flavitalea sp. BT771 TaxID=3063329 RepID=UPI0026E412A0|nr:FecR family protein [Flavitalea sp. BT771]MDO6434761.1 FecR domain-containing protein [Flavitalea sp. BT771]MDV6223661.1 FecR domain-containing protein [Flavitalea sp. BT771]
MEDEKIIALMEGYAAGTLSGEEAIAFFQWYSQAGLEEFHRVYSLSSILPGAFPETAEMPEDFRLQLEQAIRGHSENGTIPLFRRHWLGWAAAILLLISVGGYLFYHSERPTPVDNTNNNIAHSSSNDVAPGMTKAVLTLADGSRVTIDSARSGQLAVQGRTTVQHEHGAITYNSITPSKIQTNVKALLYNTLTTNRGEQSPPLTLSDGTKVWLNALSSIRFPVAFTGSSRDVAITGEAFFEIAKNPSMPFHVTTKEIDVEVLGTQFNINAYPGEPDIRTTLLEGSVRIVSGPSHSLILEPGQQARVQDGISLVKNPDIDQALAWKRGIFDFDHANLQTVLRQLARWYDIEVKFDGNVPVRSFHGKITRDLNLSQVIQLLQDVDVKFHIEGKTLTVTQ